MEHLETKKIKVLFIDRDGTIIVNTGYPYKKNDLNFLDHSIEGLKKIIYLGYKIVIVTNQSGVGRGLFTEKEYYSFNNYLLAKLKNNGVIIDNVFQCFHLPNSGCNCRKPKIGMVRKYLLENDIDLLNSFTIGDKISDMEFGEKLITRTILIDTNFKLSYKNESDIHHSIARNLLEASEIIEKFK